MYLRHIRLACLTLLLVSAARAGAANVDHPSIRPGERFEGPLFNVVAPKSDGWVGLSRNSSGMAFARHGATEPENLSVFSWARRLNNRVALLAPREREALAEQDSKLIHRALPVERRSDRFRQYVA